MPYLLPEKLVSDSLNFWPDDVIIVTVCKGTPDTPLGSYFALTSDMVVVESSQGHPKQVGVEADIMKH